MIDVPYRLESVPVRGGDLRVGVWGQAGPLIVAAHGITSSHLAWTVIGPELGRDHRFVGVDLRGRGGSRDLPDPYGMAQHADDLAAVIATYGGDPAGGDPAGGGPAGGGPVVLVGHSMGGFVVAETARRHPRLVERLVLVDGGAPLPLPPGFDLDGGEAVIDQAINETVGIAFARLTMTFPSREAYRQLWRAHPSFADWPAGADEYVDYDLVGAEPELRPACRMEAALRDARDIYALPGMVPGSLPRPALFLRAERGMFDEPDRPLYADGYARSWLPGTEESTVEGVNHYTITLGEHGAARVIAACLA